ncbi:permease family protein [Rickettsia endosymbiont of Ixodes pacificus]|nr:permease family protein [Rickettsia endosymbiont of Ixodes pacificus]
MGGYLVGVYKLDFNSAAYLTSTFQYLEPIDVISGLVKTGVFGFIISIISAIAAIIQVKGLRELEELLPRQ